jgi:hypothetical protein
MPIGSERICAELIAGEELQDSDTKNNTVSIYTDRVSTDRLNIVPRVPWLKQRNSLELPSGLRITRLFLKRIAHIQKIQKQPQI